ncbi:MAG: universal stress protein UspA [Candidatus Entotheonella factor]|uniref:Universal stress protein n=1 Tax=Entotheonella factor TaxID=1429438 RepID=W4LKR6_ENTF1|nr:MAG: universal stress protein UspA [Candidatus Entotheonella factor]
MHIQHILVPMDFSPDAEKALESAVALARQFQARITLLHAVHLPVTTEISLTAYFSEMQASAQRGMETYHKQVEDAGLPVETHVLIGVPFRKIIETAADQGADLIVMGTHGRTGVPHLMLGSVAERVVRLAPCPVWVTRQAHANAATLDA